MIFSGKNEILRFQEEFQDFKSMDWKIITRLKGAFELTDSTRYCFFYLKNYSFLYFSYVSIRQTELF